MNTNTKNIKSGFIFYTEYIEHFKLLSDSEVKSLLFAICDYHSNNTIPNLQPLPQMAFSFIKADLDRNLKKYASVCDRNKKNGKKGGRPIEEKPKKPTELFDNPKNPVGYSETQNNPKNPVGYLETQNNPKNPVGYLETQRNPKKPKKPDKEKEKEKDKEEDKEKEKEKKQPPSPLPQNFKKWTAKHFNDEIIKNGGNVYNVEMLEDFYNSWTEQNEKGIMKFQLQKTWSTNMRLKKWFKNNYSKNCCKLEVESDDIILLNPDQEKMMSGISEKHKNAIRKFLQNFKDADLRTQRKQIEQQLRIIKGMQ